MGAENLNVSTYFVGLVGPANAGKTSLFNILTGQNQKVGNYAGVTVAKSQGLLQNSCHSLNHANIQILDFPGLYSLAPHSLDESVTVEGLKDTSKPLSLILCVVNAHQLPLHLKIFLELKKLGIPLFLVINMMDVAFEQGIIIDCSKLARQVRVPVIPLMTQCSETCCDLKKKILDFFENPKNFVKQDFKNSLGQDMSTLSPTNVPNTPDPQDSRISEVSALFQQVDKIINKAVTMRSLATVKWQQRLDGLFLHPVLGILILLLILVVMFQSLFTWAEMPQQGIQWLVNQVSIGFAQGVGQIVWVPDSIKAKAISLVCDGILAGVGSVLAFLPQVLLLFFWIFLLEESGYMARAVFLLDRMMFLLGLNGRAFLPLLSSFACAIPGILSTRSLPNKSDRLTTICIAPLMTCSARLPLYALIIGAFIPNTKILGPLRLQGTVMFGLYALAIGVGLIVSWLLKKTVLKGSRSVLIMELPMYRLPNIKPIFLNLWNKGLVFVKKAGTGIILFMVILWFCSSFPQPPANAGQPPIYYSWVGIMGRSLEPVFAPIGFSWEIVVALIPAFAAREVIVGVLGAVYALEGQSHMGTSSLAHHWGFATGLSLLTWYIFAPQCLSTFVVAKKETGSWKWPIFMFTYMILLAYFASFLVYNTVSFLQVS